LQAVIVTGFKKEVFLLNKNFFILLALFAALLAFQGCNLNGNGTPTPTPTPTPGEGEGYFLSFEFEGGSALYNSVNVLIEPLDGEAVRQEMRTITLVKSAGEEFSEMEITLLEASILDSNGERDICPAMPLESKRNTLNLYRNGKADFGTYEVTTFHFPQQEVKVGDTWEFEEIEYKAEEMVSIENQAGIFECLRISFDGLQQDEFGAKYVHGYFLFDPVKKLKVKEETIEERATLKITSQNELTGIELNYSAETDYSCVFPSEGLSLGEKFISAVNYFSIGEYQGALALSLSAKQDIDAKADLNAEELELKKNLYPLVALAFERNGMAEKALAQRFENAAFFHEFISGESVSVEEFRQSYENYKLVSESGSLNAEAALEKFNDLNSMIAGRFNGKLMLKDTGETEWAKISALNGASEIWLALRGRDQAYSIPLFGFGEGDLFFALYQRPGYEPQSLPLLEATEAVLEEEFTVILSPSEDANKGYLAGFCYSLNTAGKIKKALDLNFDVLKGEEEFAAECKGGFFSLLLEPGTYTIPPLETAFEVKAGDTTVARVVQ